MRKTKILLPGIILLVAGLVLAAIAAVRVIKIFGPPDVCNSVPDGLSTGGTWGVGTNIPTARAETSAAVLDGKLYLAGGIQNGWGGLTSMEVFDPTTNSWNEDAALPMALHHVGFIGAAHRLYLIGGYDDITKMVQAQPDISKGWYYDPATHQWTAIADMPAPRAAHAIVNIDDRLYIVAGTGVGAQAVWVYDPQTDRWDTSAKGQLPTPREHVSAFVVDGKIYVIGGRWKFVNSPAVEVYDPATDTWEKRQNMPVPTSGYMGAILNGKIHIFSGENVEINCIIAAHQVYDPATDQWTLLGNLPTLRHGGGSVVIDGHWYTVGGSTKVGGQADSTISDINAYFDPEA